MILLYDAGHGGKDPGAVFNWEEEDDLALDIVLELERQTVYLHPGWSVTLVRRSPDVYISPEDRRKMIMGMRPRAFVSVHCNAGPENSATGFETYYRDAEDKILGVEIHKALVEDIPLRNRGLKSDELDLHRRLAVLSTPGVPSVLVEPGFITNAKDRLVLRDTQLVAGALLRGLERWANKYGIS